MKEKNTASLKKFCYALGLDLCGVAPAEGKFPFAVCIGAGLSGALVSEIPDHPTRPYFHHYKTVNMFLDQAAYRIVQFIQKKGHNAFPVAASQILDWEKQTGLLSHKHAAVKAGLGWIGRNNLLVNKKLGARLRLATVLTDMPLKAAPQSKEDCGACMRCVAVCPAKAIKARPEDFDHLACYQKLKEFQKLRYSEQLICGVCVNACAGKQR
ncbi:MAG: 4Fe-4S binding protein [Deltaproteobacteria bacterium]